MRKIVILLPLLVLYTFLVNAQLLQTAPRFVQETSMQPVVITFNPHLGNQGLSGYEGTVYVHIGVITSKSIGASDWKHVMTQWGDQDPAYASQKQANGDYTFTITGGLRSYFRITDPSEQIKKICLLFRNADGTLKGCNADGTDMYLPVYQQGLQLRIETPDWLPTYQPTYLLNNLHIGDTLQINGYANKTANLSIIYNQEPVNSVADTVIKQKLVIAASGRQTIELKGSIGTTDTSQSIEFTAASRTDTLPLPAGAVQGINYDNSNPSKATLVLYAPRKKSIYVMGDFNQWQKGIDGYQMHQTPDGNLFWCTLTNLTSNKTYAYQYIIDDSLVVADYNAHLILDKSNDPYIDKTTYPNLPVFPEKATGEIVSILQTGLSQYQWKTTSFKRPPTSELRVYELLVRDFVQNHNWQTLTDSLDYLQHLGINAIELMPFNEFEGNSSWGYNPDFYFAPDKYYGTSNSLKAFIDSCHARGIAVIMDMVLNHSFGQSPMVQMYFDPKTGRPTTDNPWFNPVARHAYNVGYDFNHESPATREFTKRVLKYWLSEYKIDGFRFDLAKGFTQKQTCDGNGEACNVDSWSAYDPSRVAIWDDYYAALQKEEPDSYCILEFLGNNQEEKHYANEGMLLWENANANFNQLTMGYKEGSDLSSFTYTNRGWTTNNMMVYMESHDEERLMYKNLHYGNSDGSYQIKDLPTALNRNAMATALWSAMPGPKMVWQFGELGYDYSINYCIDGLGNNDCRTGPKPPGWSLLPNPDRLRLSQVYQQMFQLRSTYPATFSTAVTASGTQLRQNNDNTKQLVLTSDSLNLVVLGNFDVVTHRLPAQFPNNGIWIPLLNGAQNQTSFLDKNLSFYLQNKDTTITLPAGAYRVFIQPRKVLNKSGWVNNLVAESQNDQMIIYWQSSHLTDTAQFMVQRQIEGGSFEPIAFVPIKEAKGNGNFQFIDKHLPAGANATYQLAIITMRGIAYSDKISMKNTQTDDPVSVFPNPSPGNFNIKFSVKQSSSIPYCVFDLTSRIIQKGTLPSTGGSLDLSRLNQGVYLLQLQLGTKKYTTKLLKK